MSSQNTEEINTFVHQTMLTCIGNKRKLVEYIYNVVDEVRQELGKEKLSLVDGFAGSSVVARRLSYLASDLYVNDLEQYSYLMAKCYLKQPWIEDQMRIVRHIEVMNNLAESGPYSEGIISRLYAPKVSANIEEGERCFYTRENALIIDTLRQYIVDHVEDELKVYCLVPLLNRASIHTNTAGVFKGFYKDGKLGKFGGKGENALSRIMAPIRLDIPEWSDSPCVAHCSQGDTNSWIRGLPTGLDLIYLDPPYNQHPYGSNYFMLNVIAKNVEPAEISRVSGIPTDWNKSVFNKQKEAKAAMKTLIESCLSKATYVLISYNNEGIITNDEWTELLANYRVKKYELDYDTFKGSRNLQSRNNKVIERMFLVSIM